MSKSARGKWYKNLGFWFKQRNKKTPVYQQFDVDIAFPAYNLIKNKTPAQVFSGEIVNFLSL